jgi:ABC-type Fe3+/spermidine/putrescine transport system ATPase subunit
VTGTPLLALEGVTRRFGETVAVHELSLEVAEGELLTLLGPSGCGKTTTLRMIGGFEQPTAGRVLIGGRDVTRVPPRRRNVGMVFQSYALFPHLDVHENVAFGLRVRGAARAAVAERVARALSLVEMEGYGRRRVQELSGGQQQRVALARALAPEPPIVLLDEPLSNLDAALRERTRDELRALLKRLGMTAVFVTHDQEEALALSDRVAVLQGGALQQVGPPETLYAAPANAFVAGFLGRANFFGASLVEEAGGLLRCRLDDGAFWDAAAAPGTPRAPGARLALMVRPEALRLVDEATEGALGGRVLDRRFAGMATFYRVRTSADGVVTAVDRAGAASAGDAVRLGLAPGAVVIAFPAEPA